ncbi:hypothetical protein ACLOJK_008344 [Asimina triloba]
MTMGALLLSMTAVVHTMIEHRLELVALRRLLWSYWSSPGKIKAASRRDETAVADLPPFSTSSCGRCFRRRRRCQRRAAVKTNPGSLLRYRAAGRLKFAAESIADDDFANSYVWRRQVPPFFWPDRLIAEGVVGRRPWLPSLVETMEHQTLVLRRCTNSGVPTVEIL